MKYVVKPESFVRVRKSVGAGEAASKRKSTPFEQKYVVTALGFSNFSVDF
jgi:hypothetical protein